jgi:hypothetical protein
MNNSYAAIPQSPNFTAQAVNELLFIATRRMVSLFFVA